MTYNGWTNRETWALMLHINNDPGWQHEAHQIVGEARADLTDWPETFVPSLDWLVEERLREQVEQTLSWEDASSDGSPSEMETIRAFWQIASDIGSLWRVNWRECALSLISDIEEDSDA